MRAFAEYGEYEQKANINNVSKFLVINFIRLCTPDVLTTENKHRAPIRLNSFQPRL